jgi:hypothetical protein
MELSEKKISEFSAWKFLKNMSFGQTSNFSPNHQKSLNLCGNFYKEKTN